jgi:hypothetical protein
MSKCVRQLKSIILIYNLVKHLSITSTLIPLVAGLIYLRQLRGQAFFVLIFYLFLSFAADLISNILSAKGKSTLYIINIYSLVELILLLVIYYRLSTEKTFKQTLLIVTSSYCFFFVLYCMFYTPISESSVVINGSEALVLIFISILFMFDSILKASNTVNSHHFWINVAILSYFSMSFFTFLAVNQIFVKNVAVPTRNLWIIHNIVHILFNSLITVAILKWRPKPNLLK